MARLTELLSTISGDLRDNGTLDSPGAVQILLENMEFLKPLRATIRDNMVNRYQEVGESATIPGFEAYLYLLDDVTPIVVETTPSANEDAEVTHLSVKFSELMEHATLNDDVVKLHNESGDPISLQILGIDEADATTIILTPTIPLPSGLYTLTVTEDAQDYGGNSLAEPVIIPFRHTLLSQLALDIESPVRLGSTTYMTASVPGDTGSVQYTWNLGDGSTTDGSTIQHLYGQVGSYSVTVTATLGAAQFTVVDIAQVNDWPIIGLAIEESGPTQLDSTTTLTATIVDGSNVTYSWDFGDGNTGSGAQVSHVYATVGIYTATVTAANGVSQTSTSTTTTVVDRPILELSTHFPVKLYRREVANPTASIAEGTNVTYFWDLGDGNTELGSEVSHSYDSAGTYTWTLSVSNGISQITTTNVVEVIEFTQISAKGSGHTCGLANDGGVICWGNNFYGQLGDGIDTEENYPAPRSVVGLNTRVDALVSGTEHSCVLDELGGVACWGSNEYGQLGNGLTEWKRTEPVQVTGLYSGVTAIAAGLYHTCALTAEGDVKCWGNNEHGQLGDGTKISRLTATTVVDLESAAIAIVAGGNHTCALTNEGKVKCWGLNSEGQVGSENIGHESDVAWPREVDGINSDILAIAAGFYHTCALTLEDSVTCWGSNQYGQLGDGVECDQSDFTGCWRFTPAQVDGLTSGITAMALGGGHSCVLTDGGDALCWGDNRLGQLGDGTTQKRLTPTPVTGLSSDLNAIDTGSGHACALTVEGGLKCWGRNSAGQLGDHTTEQRLTPVQFAGLVYTELP